MDRDRLKEVHQTDLTESKVNEDFVDWLKTKAPSWLLVFLVAICGYLGILRYKQHRADYKSNAWAALTAAQLPGSYEDVAREYADVGQVAKVANIAAADTLLRAVQNGLVLGVNPPPPPGPGEPPIAVSPDEMLSAEQRDEYLARAEGLYRKVTDADDGSDGVTVYVVSAMNGLAAIAESRGEADQAEQWYVTAAQRAEGRYEGLSNLSKLRAESAAANSMPVRFPTQADLRQRTASEVTPIEIDDMLREILLPDEDDGSPDAPINVLPGLGG